MLICVVLVRDNGEDKLKDLLHTKGTEGPLEELMEKYKAYKANYMRNMKFDPSTPGLSMCKYV